MRIGLVAPVWCSVPPSGYGGTEQVVDALARGLHELGHEVVLAATGDSTCPVPRMSLLRRPAPTIGEQLPELRHVVHAHERLADCDVIHDHTLSGPLLAVGRRSGPAVVTTCHGELSAELGDYYRQLAPHVTVIGISHAQASAAPGGVHAVVHHGVVPSDFPVGAGEGGHLLFLGRMSPDKGADRAIRAARAAGVPLLLAAKMREPSEREYFARHVEPLLGDDAHYLGEVDFATKTALLAGACALLVPIRWPEPFGMVMIEALACGTPVLAFPEGAAPEVVEHRRTGFLCRDEADMAAAVSRLGEISRADCRASAERRFSARRMAADHVRVYRSALARRNLPRPTDQAHALRQSLDLQAPLVVDLEVDLRRAERHPAQPQ